MADIYIGVTIDNPATLEVRTLSLGPLAADRFITINAPGFQIITPPRSMTQLAGFAKRLLASCEDIDNARVAEGLRS